MKYLSYINNIVLKLARGQRSQLKSGFTIVELLVVIVVIGILAAITIVAYSGISGRAIASSLQSDLNNASSQLKLYQVDHSAYPTTLDCSASPAANSICLKSSSGNLYTYTVNNNANPQTFYLTNANVNNSAGYYITNDSAATASAVRGTNYVLDFSNWTLSGGAIYNQSTGELVLGATGSAASPLLYINKPRTMKIIADFYTNIASANVSCASIGCYHTGTAYYAIDGATPATNSGGHVGNGCAHAISLGVWNLDESSCVYSGGTNVMYFRYNFFGAASTYSSPDLKIKNPRLVVSD